MVDETGARLDLHDAVAGSIDHTMVDHFRPGRERDVAYGLERGARCIVDIDRAIGIRTIEGQYTRPVIEGGAGIEIDPLQCRRAMVLDGPRKIIAPPPAAGLHRDSRRYVPWTEMR